LHLFGNSSPPYYNNSNQHRLCLQMFRSPACPKGIKDVSTLKWSLTYFWGIYLLVAINKILGCFLCNVVDV